MRKSVIALLILLPLPAHAGKSAQVRTESFELLNEGVAAYNRGDYQEAVGKLERCAAVALNSFRAHYYLGLALFADRRYAASVEALEIALDLDPSHLAAVVALGNAHLARGDTDDANASFHRALKLRAEYAPALDGLARVHESRGEDDDAITLFNRAIVANKGFAEAYTHLGDLYLRIGRLEEAIRLLSDAVSVRPDFAPGLNRLSLAYSRLGLQNEAVATIQKAISLQPKSAEHRAALGQIRLSLDLLAGAEQAFRDALALDPAQPEALEGMAEIARRRGDYEAASGYLDQALADERLDARARKRIAAQRGAIGVERTETEGIEARIASGEATSGQMRALARILAARGSWDRAADLLAHTHPVGAERERLAYLLLRAGRYRRAHELYSELASAERRADLEVNDGVALSQLGDDPAAILAYRRALSIDAHRSPALLYLGNALLRLGRREEAVAVYRLYLEEEQTGEAPERVRRILSQIAPGAVPAENRTAPPASEKGASP